MEQFTNVRIESMNINKMKNEIKHELRMVKVERVVNDNSNYIYVNDNKELTNKYFKTKDKKVIENGNYFIDNLKNIRDEHTKLLRKNFDQSLTNKTNSFCSGVLTFSDSINDLYDKDKETREDILKRGIKTIKKIAKELDTKLHYLTFHTDEKGNYHFHYYMNNFNSIGGNIGMRKKGIGEKLQDIGNEEFKELGFNRGISKKITNRKHLSIQEYKEYKENLNKVKKLEEDYKLLEKKTEALEDKNKEILAENEILQYRNDNLSEEYNNTINEIFDNLTSLKDEHNTSKFMRLVQRYTKNENADKLDSIISKYKIIIEKQNKKIMKGFKKNV